VVPFPLLVVQHSIHILIIGLEVDVHVSFTVLGDLLDLGFDLGDLVQALLKVLFLPLDPLIALLQDQPLRSLLLIVVVAVFSLLQSQSELLLAHGVPDLVQQGALALRLRQGPILAQPLPLHLRLLLTCLFEVDERVGAGDDVAFDSLDVFDLLGLQELLLLLGLHELPIGLVQLILSIVVVHEDLDVVEGDVELVLVLGVHPLLLPHEHAAIR